MAVRKPSLALVGKNAPAKPSRPPSITEAAASGDHLALLEAMRDRIAEAIQAPECPPRDLAALTRRLDDIARQIKALKNQAAQEATNATSSDEAFDASAI